MRRGPAIGVLIAAVGGVIAWWLTQAPGAGDSAGGEQRSDSHAAPGSRIASPPEVRAESLEKSGHPAAPENRPATNAQPTADAAAPSEPRRSNPTAATPAEPLPGADAKTEPDDKTRYPAQWRCHRMDSTTRRDYDVFADSSTAWSGSYSARIESRVAQPDFPGDGCYQIIAADEFKGRRVEFSLYMRTLNAVPGAHLMFRTVGEGREVEVNEAESRWVRGTSGWARHSVVIDVPIRATIIGVGARLANTGTLWIDEASLQVVLYDTPLTQTPKPPGYNSWNPDPTKHPTVLLNSGFEDTTEQPSSP